MGLIVKLYKATGKNYLAQFLYSNEEEKKNMYELFCGVLVNILGANSQRALTGKNYLKPYFVDELGEPTGENTKNIGGSFIPEDILPELIKRFVELEKATVIFDKEEIKDTFDKDKFNKLMSEKELNAYLRKQKSGEYVVQFKYGTKEQQDRIYTLFKEALLPAYGSLSARAKEGKKYIKPFFTDSKNKFTIANTKKIGGVLIPKDLLKEFSRRFVEVDEATLHIADITMKDRFNENLFDALTADKKIDVTLQKYNSEEYIFKFNYGSKSDEKQIYKTFSEEIIPAYGSTSQYQKNSGHYIKPYFVEDHNRNISSPNNTGIIGGAIVPRELAEPLAARLVELEKATLKVGNKIIEKEFDPIEYEKGLDSDKINIELDTINEYECCLQFGYQNKEQQDHIYDLFNNALLPTYGSLSPRAQEGQSYIKPYFVDNEGNMTPNNTGNIGGVFIPKDILPQFVKRFVEVDNAVVKIGNDQIKDDFNEEHFNDILNNKNRNQK